MKVQSKVRLTFGVLTQGYRERGEFEDRTDGVTGVTMGQVMEVEYCRCSAPPRNRGTNGAGMRVACLLHLIRTDVTQLHSPQQYVVLLQSLWLCQVIFKKKVQTVWETAVQHRLTAETPSE